MSTVKRVWLYIKCVSGLAQIPDVCTFSAMWWDCHDYPVTKGGDGTPSHFYDYKCWNCGKVFRI